MRRNLLLLALAFTAAFLGCLVVAAAEAQAHQNSYDSVIMRNGSEDITMRDRGQMRWVWDYARNWNNGWNELDCYRWDYGGDNCPGVHIFWNTDYGGGWSTTLNVFDWCDPNSGLRGKYRTAPDPDYVSINRCRGTDANKKKTATHELGHALGFAHPSCTSYYKDNSVMVQSWCSNYWLTPRPHDDSDYYNRWIRR